MNGSRRAPNFDDVRRTPFATARTLPWRRLSIVTMRSASPSLWVRRTTDFVAVGGHLDYPTPGDNGAVTEPSFTIPLWADLLGVASAACRAPCSPPASVGSAASTARRRHHRHHDRHGRRSSATSCWAPRRRCRATGTCSRGGAALVGMLLAGIFQRLNAVIVGLDAVVIGMFGAFGTSKALASAFPGPAVFVGVCAAVGGGMLRDVLMGLPVRSCTSDRCTRSPPASGCAFSPSRTPRAPIVPAASSASSRP
jgi:hypothetical protein